jgi:serine/threonine protein kinase
LPERQFGPYRLVQQIATGGMAEIHLARAKGIGGFEKFVALKMIHPNYSTDEHFVQMLVDEAKISVQLQHVNITHVFDLGRVGQTFYITMEYVDGCDLYKVLRKASEKDVPMPLDVAVYIAKEVCMGLDYAHRKRDVEGRPLHIVHRDISPQNVLLSYAAEVKIVDFGIAKASLRARQTAVGVIKGKYYYMSPEQAWGDPLDHRTDIFSAGILLYEMLTGQMLYLEEDMHKLLDMVRKAEIPPPSTKRRDVPRELDAIVMKALAKKREQRWQSAQDYGAALERWLHQVAPDFSPSRVSQFIEKVVGAAPPMPPPEETTSGDRALRVTKGMGREALMSRDEFADENSVIFRMADLAKGKQARSRESTTVRPKGLPPGIQPTPPRLPSGPGRAAPAGRMPDARTPAVPVGDGADQTVVSDAPSFLGADAQLGGSLDELDDRPLDDDPAADTKRPKQLGADSTADLTADSTIDRALDLDDAPTGQRPAAPAPEDEPTRLDVGAPPTPKPDLRPSSLLTPNPDEDDVLEAPTRRRKSTPRAEAASGAAAAASTPQPAVSALAPRRPPRRTPHAGVPILGGPGGPSAPAPRPASAPTVAAPPAPLPLEAPAQTPLPFRVADLPRGPTPAAGNSVFDTPPIAEPFIPEFSIDSTAAAPRITPSRRTLWLWILGTIFVIGVLAAVVAITTRTGPVAPTTATIEVISIPPGASVRIDGQLVPGQTPLKYAGAKPGTSYKLTVESPHYEPWTRDEAVPAGTSEYKVIASLKPIVGTLHVTSDPPGADVFLDGRPVGRTPLDLADVDPFTATSVEVRLRAHKPERQPIPWDAQHTARLAFKLVAAP